MNKHFARTLTLSVATAALAASAYAGTALASATTQAEWNYLQMVASEGFVTYDANQAIGHAHWVCDQFSAGRDGPSIATDVYYGNGPYSYTDAVTDVNAAATALCPWVWSNGITWSSGPRY